MPHLDWLEKDDPVDWPASARNAFAILARGAQRRMDAERAERGYVNKGG